MCSYAAPLSALALTTLAFAFAACLPQPDEPVEYLQQPDSITIQMRQADPAASALEQRLSVPTFTLYGDGTLIYAPASEPTRLLESELSDDAVRELLDSIVDAGFLNFFYQQPEPDGREGQPTTFVYAHTLSLANAVSAYALDSVVAEDAGDEWDQFRALAEIVERLRAIDPVALGGSEPVDFEPEAVVLHIQRMGEPPYEFTPNFLPASDIDLAEIVPAGSAPVEYRVTGALAAEIVRWLYIEAVRPEPNPWSVFLQQGDGTYIVTFAPLLPFEENFPEFDIQ